MTKLKPLVLMLAHFFKLKIFLSAILINLFPINANILMAQENEKKTKKQSVVKNDFGAAVIDMQKVLSKSTAWLSLQKQVKEIEEKFKEQGIKMLSNYVENIKTNTPNVIATEMSFTFQLNETTIVGTIDRLDNESGIVITDYKTSKTSTKAKNSLQLAIYSLYLEQSEDLELKGIPKKSQLYFLRDHEDPVKEHSFSSNELRDTEEKILHVSNGIRKKDFKPIKGNHCNWCDYKHLACPVYEE